MRIGKKGIVSILFLTLGLLSTDGIQASDPPVQTRPLRGVTVDGEGRGMSEERVAAGLKEALHVAVDRTVAQRGSRDGFGACPGYRIAPASELCARVTAMDDESARKQLAHLEQRMNRVAELTVATAAPLLHEVVARLEIPYAIEVLREDDVAATTFLQRFKGSQIEERFSTLVRSKMAEAGIYNDVSNLLRILEHTADAEKSMYDKLHAHISAEALAAVFATLKHEEYVIRTEPEARTSELLAQVFSR
ncbi:MAG: DUF4197 family protein [Desulfuromonadaceae bacterium]